MAEEVLVQAWDYFTDCIGTYTSKASFPLGFEELYKYHSVRSYAIEIYIVILIL